MKYLCLIYTEPRQVQLLPAAERAAVERQCLEYQAALRDRDRLLGAEALQEGAATTVRVRDGHLLATDGPCARSAEQLSGFFLIDAHDLNAAIRIATRIPAARLGSVEVRPVREPGAGPR